MCGTRVNQPACCVENRWVQSLPVVSPDCFVSSTMLEWNTLLWGRLTLCRAVSTTSQRSSHLTRQTNAFLSKCHFVYTYCFGQSLSIYFSVTVRVFNLSRLLFPFDSGHLVKPIIHYHDLSLVFPFISESK